MDPIAIVALIVGPIVAIAFLVANSQTQAKARDVWEQAAQQLGLQLQEGNRLEGQCAGFPMTVSRVAEKNGMRAHVRIGAQGRIPTSLSLQRRSEVTLFKRLAETEIKVGDAAFDSFLFVQGEESMVHAVLDESCRDRVMATFSEKLVPSLSGAVLSYATQSPDDSALLTSYVRDGIALAQALCLAENEIPAHLVRNIESDDRPDVRLRGLDVLMRTCEDQALVRKTLHALLSDPVPRVRIATLAHLGPAEVERLLAQLERDEDTGVRVALLDHLAEFAGARLWPAIKDALRSKDQTLQQAAAKAARATSYAALAPRIARKITRNSAAGEPSTLIALAETLGALRDPRTEPALVSLLTHASRDVQGAAAAALGDLGSVTAVEPLLACSESMLFGGDTKRAVLDAVGRIQSRLGEVATGGLSLAQADSTTGALSIAAQAPTEGALSSLPEDTAKDRSRT